MSAIHHRDVARVGHLLRVADSTLDRLFPIAAGELLVYLFWSPVRPFGGLLLVTGAVLALLWALTDYREVAA